MGLIAAVYLCIGWYEQGYMKRQKRSKRAKRRMWSMTFLLLFTTEAIYLTRERMSVAMMMRYLFYGIQKALFFEL
ncbi:hypothetical protein [Paenibacillus sp. NFR01]|uniref:hypothetical protein n=1 Tax=Paenibacillus sp. NFR01 TaxID=1566279 RepID=UPI0008CAD209|nr:hypothetical protein [Paenibacillus sp. NFR01]SET15416.1 hypothetical protein SAMN03159358_0865 [Paenibacillus sp. NFR01]